MRPQGINAFLAAAILMTAAGLSGCEAVSRHYGGSFLPPEDAYEDGGLDEKDKHLINEAFRGFENKTIRDFHVHFFGNGKPENYTYCKGLAKLERPEANPELLRKHTSFPWFVKPFVKDIFLAGMGNLDENELDEQYMKRLVALAANHGPPEYAQHPSGSPYRSEFYLLAMDDVYEEDGTRNKESSFFFVSNEYIVRMVECLNEKIAQSGRFTQNRFVAVGSINPMNKKWREEIAFLAANGVRLIKWRPPSMRIDPQNVPAEFYTELAKHNIGILSHTGRSGTLELDKELDEYADPERLLCAVLPGRAGCANGKSSLQTTGTSMVMFHMGRLGASEEAFGILEKSSGLPIETRIKGEISAIEYEGTHRILEKVMNYPDSSRFLNGSDYPIGLKALVEGSFLKEGSLKKLYGEKWLTKDEADSLRRIYRYNPLLFDFVMKRTLKKSGRRIVSGKIFTNEFPPPIAP